MELAVMRAKAEKAKIETDREPILAKPENDRESPRVKFNIERDREPLKVRFDKDPDPQKWKFKEDFEPETVKPRWSPGQGSSSGEVYLARTVGVQAMTTYKKYSGDQWRYQHKTQGFRRAGEVTTEPNMTSGIRVYR